MVELQSGCTKCGCNFTWDQKYSDNPPFCPKCGYDTILGGKRGYKLNAFRAIIEFFSKLFGPIEKSPTGDELKKQLSIQSDIISFKLITSAPRSTTEIQLEIISTEGGGFDFFLTEIHPKSNFKDICLDSTFSYIVSKFPPLAKKCYPGWTKTLFFLTKKTGSLLHIRVEHKIT